MKEKIAGVTVSAPKGHVIGVEVECAAKKILFLEMELISSDAKP